MHPWSILGGTATGIKSREGAVLGGSGEESQSVGSLAVEEVLMSEEGNI